MNCCLGFTDPSFFISPCRSRRRGGCSTKYSRKARRRNALSGLRGYGQGHEGGRALGSIMKATRAQRARKAIHQLPPPAPTSRLPLARKKKARTVFRPG